MKVSIQNQALLRWMVLAALLVALRFTNHAPGNVQRALWVSFGALFVSAFLWPRCPHCRAPAVHFGKLEWVPDVICWRCRRPYDELETPPYAVDLFDVGEKAVRLLKKDPETAHRLLAEAESRYETALTAEKASLRERLRTDPTAAVILRARLQQELDGTRRTLKKLRTAVQNDPEAAPRVQGMEDLERALHQELRDLEAMPPLVTG